jgi:hypothetical protein
MAMRSVTPVVAAGLLLLALSSGRGQELPNPKKLPDSEKNDLKKLPDDDKADADKNGKEGKEGSSAYTRRKPPAEREAHPVDPFMPPAPAIVDPRTGYWQQVAPWPVIGGIAGWPVVEGGVTLPPPQRSFFYRVFHPKLPVGLTHPTAAAVAAPAASSGWHWPNLFGGAACLPDMPWQ